MYGNLTYESDYRANTIGSLCSTLSRGEATEVLKRWFVDSKGTVNVSKSYC